MMRKPRPGGVGPSGAAGDGFSFVCYQRATLWGAWFDTSHVYSLIIIIIIIIIICTTKKKLMISYFAPRIL